MADIPPLGSGGVTVVGLLVAAIVGLWGVVIKVAQWGAGQAEKRVEDHKEHSRDLMEVTRTIDKATDALTRERPDAGR